MVSRRILLIDDDRRIRESLELMLGGAGFTVLSAESGAVALEILRGATVDLILSDIAMPDMNGYQLYEAVRANPEWLGIPFVFLSARAMDSDIRYGKELGVDDYLSKPVRLEDLLSTVKGKLRRAAQLRTLADGQSVSGSELLTLGALQVDLGRHEARLGGAVLQLSQREFIVLACLARRPNHAISHAELIKATHHMAVDEAEASDLLRPLVRSLRRKLGAPTGASGPIDNVRGVGYRLRAEAL